MGLKGFILGGIIGFSIGVYHGYNYANEECKKEYLTEKTTVAYEIRQQTQDCSSCIETSLEKIIGEKAKITYANLNR
jgi:hypothetical protein